MKYTCLLLFCLVLLLAACGSGARPPASISQPTATPTATPTAEPTTSDPSKPRPVSFTTSDHIQLAGLVYGFGKTAIICTHMAYASKAAWVDSGLPQRLATLGYSVLVFDFRGNGDSQGFRRPSTLDIDLQAAVGLVQQQGATRIVLMGASMGGTAALKVAAEVPVTAVISLSGPQSYGIEVTDDELKALKIPKLFMVSADDAAFSIDANHMYEVASKPKEIKIYPGRVHGTNLFLGGLDDDPAQRVLRFIRQNAPVK